MGGNSGGDAMGEILYHMGGCVTSLLPTSYYNGDTRHLVVISAVTVATVAVATRSDDRRYVKKINAGALAHLLT